IASRAAVATRISREFHDQPSHSAAEPILPRDNPRTVSITSRERDDESVSTIYWVDRPVSFWESFKRTFCCCCVNDALSEGSVPVAPEEDRRMEHVSIYDPDSTFDLPDTLPHVDDRIVIDEVPDSFQVVSVEAVGSLPSHTGDELDRLIDLLRPSPSSTT
ncbi:hypothetical protein PENTCL1PPCAC_29028, partial [Pristionchus entomophagus]